MLQESHVGVGILGKEGAHAAMSSDFVIYRFHHLRRLLCIHGRYAYWRTSQLVMQSFYKNICFPIPLFWFQFFCQGSGQALFDSILISNFNMFFSSVPPFMVGVLDKDVREDVLMSRPEAYASFKRDPPFTIRRFNYYVSVGIYQSVILFFAVYLLFNGNDVIQSGGQSEGMWVMGNLCLTSCVLVVNLFLLFDCAWITWWNVFAFWFGLVWYIALFVFCSVQYLPGLSPDAYGIGLPIFNSPSSWLYILLTVFVCSAPVAVQKMLFRLFRPKQYQVLQRITPQQASKELADDTRHQKELHIATESANNAADAGAGENGGVLHMLGGSADQKSPKSQLKTNNISTALPLAPGDDVIGVPLHELGQIVHQDASVIEIMSPSCVVDLNSSAGSTAAAGAAGGTGTGGGSRANDRQNSHSPSPFVVSHSQRGSRNNAPTQASDDTHLKVANASGRESPHVLSSADQSPDRSFDDVNESTSLQHAQSANARSTSVIQLSQGNSSQMQPQPSTTAETTTREHPPQ